MLQTLNCKHVELQQFSISYILSNELLLIMRTCFGKLQICVEATFNFIARPNKQHKIKSMLGLLDFPLKNQAQSRSEYEHHQINYYRIDAQLCKCFLLDVFHLHFLKSKN